MVASSAAVRATLKKCRLSTEEGISLDALSACRTGGNPTIKSPWDSVPLTSGFAEFCFSSTAAVNASNTLLMAFRLRRVHSPLDKALMVLERTGQLLLQALALKPAFAHSQRVQPVARLSPVVLSGNQLTSPQLEYARFAAV